MVTITQLSGTQLDAYFERLWASYKSELMQAGASEPQAERNIAETLSEVFTEGVLNSNQYIFDALVGDIRVGQLWLVDNTDNLNGSWSIYDIEIDEEFQGKGLGRATMIAAEEFVKTYGGKEISLSVFGFNTKARSLYESLGYNITRMQMKKELS